MSKSDYHFDVRHNVVDGVEIRTIEIIDLNLGRMSVTNDIENVVREISGQIRDLTDEDPLDFAWMYRDSGKDWDELVLDSAGNFTRFAALERDRWLGDLRAEVAARHLARRKEAET